MNFEYEVGDVFGVWFINCLELVDELLFVIVLKVDVFVLVLGVGDVWFGDVFVCYFDIMCLYLDMLVFIVLCSVNGVLKLLFGDDCKGDFK